MSLQQIVLLCAALVVAFWIVGARSRLVRLRAAVGAAWAQFDAQLRRRARALPELLASLQPAMEGERSALEAVRTAEALVHGTADAMRQLPPSAQGAAALQAALAHLDSALARMLALLDQHPQLREIEAVHGALRELHDIDLRLAFARQLYNAASESYDAALAQFPTRLLVGLLRLDPAGRL